MAAATREELQGMLGDVDEQIIERIAATGAAVEEVTEAVTALEDELGFGEQQHIPSSARVSEVRSILEEQVAVEEDEFAVFDQRDTF